MESTLGPFPPPPGFNSIPVIVGSVAWSGWHAANIMVTAAADKSVFRAF